MKPRAFIGSSVEGLNVAYAVQQNLVHQVETTVWDQGIFNLSSTTIESLTAILNDVDFGIFVFSPDDIVKVRGESSASVRDNVLFEMGLFIGKLGRERVFFLLPRKSDIRVPTDLLGVTPGTFDADREDGSMQAATGPACHQIRTQIAKLGLSTPEREQTGEPEKPVQDEISESWMYDLFKDEFDRAKTKIQTEIEKCDGDGKNNLLAWSLYIDVKKNLDGGVGALFEFAAKHRRDPKLQSLVMSFLTWEEHYVDAISLHSKLDSDIASDPELIKALAQCHIASEHPEDALGLLTGQSITNNPEYALIVSSIYENDEKYDKSLDILHEAIEVHPSHEQLRYRFGKIAIEKGMWEIALHLFSTLKFDFPKNSNYWGYFGNCCLELELYDTAFTSYTLADELANHGAGWIAGNLGNLFSNKNLPSEAIKYLKRATTLDETSLYAFDRMASALKKKEEEDKLLKVKKTNGKLLLQNFAKNREEEEHQKFTEIKGLSSLINQ